jgi:hypothetical protein
MKKLSEMKIAKSAILSDYELSTLGGRPVGSGTNYEGPDNPTFITTLVDNQQLPGNDGEIGNIAGDSWNITLAPIGDGGSSKNQPGVITL